MTQQDQEFERTTARMLHREALRRAARELSTASPAGLEDALARISAEVTAEAAQVKGEAKAPHVSWPEAPRPPSP